MCNASTICSSSKGEALQTVQQFPFSSENYKEAWKALTLRYSNKQLILANRLRALLDAESIKRKSAGQLSNLVDAYRALVNALKAEEVVEDAVVSRQD